MPERQKEIFYMQHPALSENEKEGMELWTTEIDGFLDTGDEKP